MSRVTQEMYCTKSGGGCGGYIKIKINMELNHVVKVVCPKCGHEHQRKIEDGMIKEDGRWEGKVIEELCPTMAAYRTQEQGPWSKALFDQVEKADKTPPHRSAIKRERDGVPLENDEDYAPGTRSREADLMIKQAWFEHFGDGQT